MREICGKNVNKLLETLWERCVKIGGVVYKKLRRIATYTQIKIIHRNMQEFCIGIYTGENEDFTVLGGSYPHYPHRTTTITTIYNGFSKNIENSFLEKVAGKFNCLFYRCYNFKKETLWK